MSTSPSGERALPSLTQNTQVLALDDIIPYWRNPRKVSQEAVNAVAESMAEFSYNQPIVVDSERVIIIGHTRYAAMRRMGVTHAEVVVEDTLTPAQVKQLRIIDNRAGEYSEWDYEKLTEEMEELESEILSRFFPEMVDADVEVVHETGDDDDALDEPVSDDTVDLICPSCFHGWTTRVTRQDIFTGIIRAEGH